MVRVRIQPAGTQAIRELRSRAAEISPALISAARAATPEMVASAQRAARTMKIVSLTPSKRRRPAEPSTGVREAMARAIHSRRDEKGVTIFIAMTQMPAGKETLPRLTSQKSWRHPVYGNTAVWTAQRGKPNWFRNAVRRVAVKRVPEEIQRVMERIIS